METLDLNWFVKMIVDCISDLHGFQPELPGGDLLILAGDYTARDRLTEWSAFFHWLKKQKYDKKIVIAGNHDNLFETGFPKTQQEAIDFEYLCDSGMEYNGLKIWGTPWTPLFDGVNPKCKAFMKSDMAINKKFSKIPEGLDILITHGPMYRILDGNRDGYACGSQSLRQHIDRAPPRFHVFGHIHEQGGNQLMYKHCGPNTWCVNCSYVDENYKPVHIHVRIEL